MHTIVAGRELADSNPRSPTNLLSDAEQTELIVQRTVDFNVAIQYGRCLIRGTLRVTTASAVCLGLIKQGRHVHAAGLSCR